MSPLRRILAASTGLAGGLGLGLIIAEPDLVSLGAAAVLGLALWWLVRIVVPREHWATAGMVVALGFSVRLAAVAVLHSFAVATGREWLYIVGDDRDYAMLSWNLVLYIQGQGAEPWIPPGFNGLTHLFGTFVYLETAMFALFGPNLQLVQTINAFFGGAMLVFLFDLGRRLVGVRPASLGALITAVHPSLVVWSALNLKEGLASLLLVMVLRQVAVFTSRPDWRPVALAYSFLIPLESLRRYVFVGLDLLILIAVLIAPRLRPWARLRAGAAAAAVTLAFLALNQLTLSQLGLLNILPTLEHSRRVMNDAARTGFVERPLTVQTGDTFVVSLPERTCGTPAEHVVSSDTRILVAPADGPSPADTAGTVYVRPCDVIVVGPAGSTAAPEPRPIVLSETDSGVRFRGEGDTNDLALTRTLAYLPRGLAFALGAPFPWALARPLDALTVPEMIYWYIAVVAAATTVWRERARWRELAPPVLFVVGTLAIFALAEGNYGTLFRHRGMVIPITTILAAPTLLAVFERRVRWRPASSVAHGHLASQR